MNMTLPNDEWPYCGVESLRRDQILDFYRWILDEEDAFARIHMEHFDLARVEAGLRAWERLPPTASSSVRVFFRDASDAVLFKLKFSGS
jgi:hypothetical protein